MIDLAAGDDRIRFSPYCWRTKLALTHKGLDFEARPWRFTDHAMLAPTGSTRVPVIRDAAREPGRWIADSWQIALHLDATYPEKPLMRDDGARAAARLVASWCDMALHPAISRFAVLDIHDAIDPGDRAYFRQSREQRFGKTLEEVSANRDGNLAAVRRALEPLRATLATQSFVGGEKPLYADYIVIGMLQWARCISPIETLAKDDPVHAWRDRMLDLHGGFARLAPACAA